MAEYNRYRSIYSHEELMERLSKLKHFALDMDGTIYLGATLFPYTKAFLAGAKDMDMRYSFLTNNPSASIADYLAKTAQAGDLILTMGAGDVYKIAGLVLGKLN